MDASLKTKLQDDLKQALKSGDKTRVTVIRTVLSGIGYAEMAKRTAIVNANPSISETEVAKQTALSEPDILGIIAREVKQREESILAFKEGNRPDLMEKEEAEKAILQAYLPKQLSRDEIVAEAKRIIAEVGAQGPRDKGKVMPKLVASLKGKADGREINEVVTELLGS